MTPHWAPIGTLGCVVGRQALSLSPSNLSVMARIVLTNREHVMAIGAMG